MVSSGPPPRAAPLLYRLAGVATLAAMNALPQPAQQGRIDNRPSGLVPMCGHVATTLEKILTRLEHLSDQLSPEPREARGDPAVPSGLIGVVSWSCETAARCITMLDRIEHLGGFDLPSQRGDPIRG